VHVYTWRERGGGGEREEVCVVYERGGERERLSFLFKIKKI
jgi:hypothetical protein